MTSLSTIAEGDIYFATKLRAKAWTGATSPDKQTALWEATRVIDRFVYVGWKTDPDQEHEWPRNGVYKSGILLPNDVIPDDILIAQYEIAFAFLKGVDPERQLASMHVTSRGISSVRTTYDPRLIPDFLIYGIPSALGWSYLLPYFDFQGASGIIKIHRVS